MVNLITINLAQSNQRFIFFLGIALLIHVLVIFQIGFRLPTPKPPQPKLLDIVISPQKSSLSQVKNADYYADQNQLGGGQKDKKQPTANSLLKPQNTSTRPLKPLKKQKESPHTQTSTTHLPSELSTRQKKQLKTRQMHQMTEKKPKQSKKIQQAARTITTHKSVQKKKLDLDYIHSLKQQIVDLEADIKQKSSIYSRRSKHKYVNASTAKAVDAQYIRQWTRKIERIGNLNYPAQARKKGLYGKLILAVTLSPQGEVLNIKIIRSSGKKILDDAARRIVELASPFAPIPENVLQGNNALVITRTWLFSRQGSNGLFSTN